MTAGPGNRPFQISSDYILAPEQFIPGSSYTAKDMIQAPIFYFGSHIAVQHHVSEKQKLQTGIFLAVFILFWFLLVFFIRSDRWLTPGLIFRGKFHLHFSAPPYPLFGVRFTAVIKNCRGHL